MEQKILTKSSMVSRLPKFGSRSISGTSSPLPNGGTQTAPIQEVKNPPGKPNGVVRATSFSMKWRKENSGPVEPSSLDGSHLPEEKKDVRSPQSPGNKDLKSSSTCLTKMRWSSPSFSTGSPKSVPKSPKSIPSPKAKSKNSQITPTTNSQDTTPKASGSKLTQNGSSGLQRPRANTGSQRNSSSDSLSQSNDSLSRQSVVPESMVRSQSFTHFKQLPSPTDAPMTRSFSFNKAVELAKPLANTQLRPSRTSGLRIPQSFSKGRLMLGLGFKKEMSDPLPAATSPSDTLTPPNAIKRPLLPNSVLTKPSLQAYKLKRPIAAKPQCPVVVGRRHVDIITPPLTPDMPHCAIKSALASTDSHGGPLAEQELVGSLQFFGEGPEDMSLSSASSLERNDTSEEYLDDFENPGDQSQSGITPNKSPVATPTQTGLQSSLNETNDWAGIGLGGGKADLCAGPPGGPPDVSPEVDHHALSSLELSPSNSSGGTYMWDEEGMEPLGQNTHMHHCSSYESDLNSIDILNNLDNTGSCDLEDDDLMLDVDLSEEGALRGDVMAHFERSERGGRPTQWKRRQKWSGTDHTYNDNRPAVLLFDGGRTTRRPLHPAVQLDGHMGALDELILKHMTEDCNSVKSQLLKLKSLLQMDDGEITLESLETSEDDSKARQMEEMMKEVSYLRKELKNKDQIINRLTRQQQESQKSGVKGERRTHHDKSTQTTWRPPHHHHAPPVLQPTSHTPNDTLIQKTLAKTVPTGVRSEVCSAGEGSPASCSPVPCTTVVAPSPSSAGVPHKESRSLPDPEELSQLLSTHLCIQDNRETDSRRKGEQTLYNLQNKFLQTSHPQSFFNPRVLQRPRLHRRVTLPALSVGGSSGSNAKPGPTMNHNPEQLPPPTRGLPCITTGISTGHKCLGERLSVMNENSC